MPDMPDDPPQAAIVIPHYNDPARLEACLAALAAQSAGHRVEIVVADNASTVDLAPLRAAFAQVRFVSEARKGAAPARNAGVAASSAPWLFFVDCDCVPAADWLDRAMALGGQARMVGGRVTLFDETPPPRSGAEAFETVFAFPQKTYIARKRFSVTANLLVTREMFDAVGGFRPGVAEDYDWCRRAGHLGYPIVYAPELAVAHPTRSDWAALLRKWRRITAEGYAVNGTGPAARLRWGLRALAVAASGPAHLPRVLASADLSPAEKLAGAKTLLHLRVRRASWMLRQAAFAGSRRP